MINTKSWLLEKYGLSPNAQLHVCVTVGVP